MNALVRAVLEGLPADPKAPPAVVLVAVPTVRAREVAISQLRDGLGWTFAASEMRFTNIDTGDRVLLRVCCAPYHVNALRGIEFSGVVFWPKEPSAEVRRMLEPMRRRAVVRRVIG